MCGIFAIIRKEMLLAPERRTSVLTLTKKTKKFLFLFVVFFLIFTAFTLLLKIVDVQAIGPEGTKVGFAKINAAMRDKMGVNLTFYKTADRLGLLAFVVIAFFGTVGLLQWITRKNIFLVDREILVLGVFYLIVGAFYLAFNKIIVVNYRPMILAADKGIEASYPSSHTVLAISVMATAMHQFPRFFRENRTACRVLQGICAVVGILIILCRACSGVHWFTDIIGALLLSNALLLLYFAGIEFAKSLVIKKIEK